MNAPGFRCWLASLVCLCLLLGEAGARPRPRPVPLVPYQPQSREATPAPDITLPPPEEWPVDLPSRPLSADEAARLSLWHQGNVTIAGHQVQAQKGVTQQVRAALYPTITLSGTYTDTIYTTRGNTATTTSGFVGPGSSGNATDENNLSSLNNLNGVSSNGLNTNGVGTSNPVTINLAFRQLLWDFNHTRDMVAQSVELERASAANYTQTQYDEIFNVKVVYYGWVQAERLREVYRSNLSAQQQHLSEARARFQEGVGLASDVTRAQTSVSEAVLNTTTAQVNATVARTNLANLIGIDPRIPLQAAESHEAAVNISEPQALYRLALEKRPEIEYAQHYLKSLHWALAAAHSNNAPSITATLQYVSFGNRFPPDQSTLNFLLGLNWALFDGGLTQGKIKQAEENLNIGEAQLANYRNRIFTDVSQGYLQAREAEQRLLTTEIELANARETLEIAAGRYRAGLGIFLDVVDAQNAVLTASVNNVNAQTAIEQTRATLNHALGVPLVATLTRPPYQEPEPALPPAAPAPPGTDLPKRDPFDLLHPKFVPVMPPIPHIDTKKRAK